MFYWNTQGTNDEVKPGKVECWVDDAMDQISTVNAFGTAAAGTMYVVSCLTNSEANGVKLTQCIWQVFRYFASEP